MDVMLISTPHTISPTTSRSTARHEFAYPRVQQIAPRAHTVLVSSLSSRRPSTPVASR